MDSTQSVDLPGTLTVFTSGFVGTLLVVFALLLVIAGLLMPLYVIHISGQIDKMRKALDKLVWHAQRDAERDERRF